MTAALAISTFLPDLIRAEFPELEAHEELFAELSAFCSNVMQQRLDERGKETAALVRLLELQLRLLEALGDRWVSVLQVAPDRQLDSFILAELQSTDTKRQLALRHLQTASQVFGDLVEFIGALFDGLPPEPAIGRIQQLYGATPSVELAEDPDGRSFLGWLLALLVGGHAANNQNIDDVSFWAHRALTASRQVKALLAHEVRVLRGTRARIESDVARSDWDDEEIEVEKRSWQDL